MGDAYLHRVIRDKPDVNSVLEKEEPIGVGTEFRVTAGVQAAGVIPKVLFYYLGPAVRKLVVRTLTAGDVTLVAEDFLLTGVVQMYVDRTNNIVFFSLGPSQSGIWTSRGVYSFSYNPDTGIPTTSPPFTLIYTGTATIDALFADPSTSKLYFNGDLGSTAISRMNYNGTGEELVSGVIGNPKSIWMEEGGTDIYVADTGIGQIHLIDISGGLPGSDTQWYQEDSPAFGASTWYDWSEIIVDVAMGEAFLRADGQGSLFHIDWPTPPATPTSHPPAYSTIIYEQSASLGFAHDLDTAQRFMYLHNNNDEITYRYNYENQLMENEVIMANLTSAIYSMTGVVFLKGG